MGSEPNNAASDFVLWMIPDPESAKRLGEMIAHFSNTFNTPLFSPHITLARVPHWPLPKIIKQTKQLTSEFSEFTLLMRSPVCGKQPYQTFVSEIHPAPPVLKFSERIDTLFKGAYGKREFFHVSLLYGQIPCDDLMAEFEELKTKLPDKISIQSISLVKVKGEVEEWQIIHNEFLD